MPCKATITARGAPPSASQWRSGRRTPSRATIASLPICGITPPSRTGAKLGAQAPRPAQSNKNRLARKTRTSHLAGAFRQCISVTQHQNTDHQDVIDQVLAERQNGGLIIKELRARHVQPGPAAITQHVTAGTDHFI